jgi:hypothetical protein
MSGSEESLAQSSSSTQIRYPTFQLLDYGKFQPRDTISLSSKAALYSTGAGIFVSAVKASLGPERTAIGSFVKHSRYVMLYGEHFLKL